MGNVRDVRDKTDLKLKNSTDNLICPCYFSFYFKNTPYNGMLVIYLYTFRHMKMPEQYTFRHMKPCYRYTFWHIKPAQRYTFRHIKPKFRCLFRDSLRLFNPSCFAPYALKGQKLLAQGIALGIIAISKTPCKGKSFVDCLVSESFCPYRATGLCS